MLYHARQEKTTLKKQQKQPSGVTAKRIFHIHGPVVLDLREEVQKVNNPSKIEKRTRKRQ